MLNLFAKQNNLNESINSHEQMDFAYKQIDSVIENYLSRFNENK